MAAEEQLYMEGVLLKRQRGLKNMSTKLKFQERYCRLTSTSLDYYDPKKKTVRVYAIHCLYCLFPSNLFPVLCILCSQLVERLVATSCWS